VQLATRGPPPGLWWHDAAYVESGRAACCLDPFCSVPPGRRRFVVEEV
jgi:hypothetical protein